MSQQIRIRLEWDAPFLDVGLPEDRWFELQAGCVELVLLESELSTARREASLAPHLGPGELVVLASTEANVPDHVARLLDEYTAYVTRITVESDNPEVPHVMKQVLYPGHVSPDVRSFFDPYVDELHAAATRLIRLLRWLGNFAGSGHTLTRVSTSWSFDDETWWPLPECEVQPEIVGLMERGLTDDAEPLIQRILDDDRLVEPLGHELLHEAVGLQAVNPRASLVLAVAAAEVGLKTFAGRNDPARGWLLSELQRLSLSLRQHVVLPWLGGCGPPLASLRGVFGVRFHLRQACARSPF